MTGAIRAYAAANQAPVVVPFILGGAMGPVTLAGDIAQAHAETMVGIALGQLVRPGSPVIYGNFLSSMALRSGVADVRHARAGDRLARRRPAGAPARPAAALRRRLHGVQDPRRPGDGGVDDVDAVGDPVRRELRAPLGGLARGRAGDGLREVRDGRRLLRRAAQLAARVCRSTTTSSRSTASTSSGPGKHFFSAQHTLRHYETAFYDSPTADNNSFEQWRDAGESRTEERAAAIVAKTLAEYERAAARRGGRRGAARLHRPHEGVDARYVVLTDAARSGSRSRRRSRGRTGGSTQCRSRAATASRCRSRRGPASRR